MSETYHTDLPNIMHEMIDDEVVVVNLDNGTYYSFDGVGGQVWDLLGGAGRGLTALNAKVASLYAGEPEQIAAAVARFIAQLAAEGLLRVAAGDAPSGQAPGDTGDAAGDAPVTPFTEPTLQKYTDMEALLLADPIHEVDDAGWPHLK
jgi:hypothetical protein